MTVRLWTKTMSAAAIDIRKRTNRVPGVMTVLTAVVAFFMTAGSTPGQSTKPAFSVASIKRNASAQSSPSQQVQPGLFNATSVAVLQLIRFAYDVPEFQLVGIPAWVRSDRFDVTAKADGDTEFARVRLMMQSLLEDRFKLVVKTEKRRMNAFVLRIARADGRLGSRLERAPDNCDTPQGRTEPKPRKLPAGGGSGMVGFGDCEDPATMARGFAKMIDAPVIDKTGLKGRWNYTIYFALADPSPRVAANPDLPSLFDALREQLGLKVDRQSADVDVLVIKSIQPPTDN